MVDTSHQGKVFYFSGTFQVELYNRLENWGVLGKRRKKKKCGAESRTWTVKTGLRFRHSVHVGWSNSLRKRRYVDSVVQVSVPDPIFPKSRANWIYLDSKSHLGLSVLRLEVGQGRVDAASLPCASSLGARLACGPYPGICETRPSEGAAQRFLRCP